MVTVVTGSLGWSSTWADAPVDDLGFVEFEAARHTGVVGSRQARRLPDSTVHVADASHERQTTMVVVTDPRLVAGHRPGRLDPPYQSRRRQGGQHVVHGLLGHVGRPRARP